MQDRGGVEREEGGGGGPEKGELVFKLHSSSVDRSRLQSLYLQGLGFMIVSTAAQTRWQAVGENIQAQDTETSPEDDRSKCCPLWLETAAADAPYSVLYQQQAAVCRQQAAETQIQLPGPSSVPITVPWQAAVLHPYLVSGQATIQTPLFVYPDKLQNHEIVSVLQQAA